MWPSELHMLDCWSFIPLMCSCAYERIADKSGVKNSLPNTPTDNLPGIIWKMWGNQLSGELYCKLLVASTAVSSSIRLYFCYWWNTMQCFGRVESNLSKTLICIFTKLDLVTVLSGLNMACSSLGQFFSVCWF